MIKVQHIQASICASTGARIDTLICEYPRVIHSQLMTHRVFSKNSSSTRAIPLEKAIEQINADPAEYIWTQNQAGMQGEVFTDPSKLHDLEEVFHTAKENAMYMAHKLLTLGAHKQNAGRLLEPFQNIKIVLTSTEWENWDWLRIDGAAQGEIAELARAIKKARDEAEPMMLKEGELHVPFVERERSAGTGDLIYSIPAPGKDIWFTAEQALKVSASVCAQTSYRNSDYSLEKAEKMYEMLTGSDHIHASPFEHQALTIPEFNQNDGRHSQWPKGVTHVDRKGNLWSGNLKGFIQHRQLIKGHDYALHEQE